jgi:predicted nucleotidyltransferase component of viral defense system
MPGGTGIAVRDFALITLAGHLSAHFPRQLVLEGGFVLRHVHGLLRFSKDIDAARHEPPGLELDGEEVAEAVRQASTRNIVRFSPDEPATGSSRSLDFDNVQVVSRRHLEAVLREYVRHYNEARPRRGLGLAPPLPRPAPRATGEVVCRDVLGDILHEYEHAA